MQKLLKNEKLYSSIRLIYVITVILYSLIRQNITALQPYLLSDLLNLAVIGVAGILVAWDAFVFKNIWKTKYIWLLISFAFATVVSTVIGFEWGYVENVKALANIFIQFFLLYVVSLGQDRAEIEKEAKIVATSIAVVWFAAAVVSLYMYFADITYTQPRYLWGDVTEIVQGFVREHMGGTVMRLWGCFVDPNFAAGISVAVISLGLFVIFTASHKALKVFHIINIIVQFFYIVLSNSRSAILILCGVLFVGGWYFAPCFIKEKKLNVIIREIVSVVMAVVFVGVGYISVRGTKVALPYVRYGIEYIAVELEKDPADTSSQEHQTSSETSSGASSDASSEPSSDTSSGSSSDVSSEPSSSDAPVSSDTSSKGPVLEDLNRDDIDAKQDKTNGRIDLWMEGINSVFKDNMLFGVGPRNYHAVAKTVDPELKISTGFSIHNSFVELLMGNGLVGTLILFVFFLLCAKDAIVLKYKNSKASKPAGLLMLAVLGLLACGMFISCLFYTLSGATVIMFTFLGYSVRLCALSK